MTAPAARPAAERLRAARDVLGIALAAALVAGSAQVLVAVFRRFGMNQLTFNGIDLIWMAPVGTVAVFLVPGAALALLAALWPAAAPIRLVTAVFVFLAAVSFLLLFKQLHPWASVILALGLATWLSGILARRPDRAVRGARRLAITLAAAVALATVAVFGGLKLRASRIVADLPAPPESAPNILLLILDTVRADALGTYGYVRPTSPRLDALAARGVVFDWAIVPSTWTLASHASMFTGRRPGELSARWWTPLDGSHATLAETLRNQGYLTAGFTANYYYTGHEAGLARGFLHYEDLVRTGRQVLWSASLAQVPMLRALTRARSPGDVWDAIRRFDIRITGRSTSRIHKTADRVTGDALRWIGRQDGTRPFFVFLNLFDAHDKREYLEPAFDRFGTGSRARYDGFLARMDAAVGGMLDQLARRGLLENTVVVITSDHGELFGEHGIRDHGNSLYLPTLRVPLIVVSPRRIPAGVRVPQPVALQDLPATLLDLAGLREARALPGTSLAEYWRPGGGSARTVFSEVERFKDAESPGPAQKGPMRSLLDGEWHYILNGDGSEELYAWRRDPDELDNVAERDRGSEHFTRLSAAARAYQSGYGTPVR